MLKKSFKQIVLKKKAIHLYAGTVHVISEIKVSLTLLRLSNKKLFKPMLTTVIVKLKKEKRMYKQKNFKSRIIPKSSIRRIIK